MAIGQPLLCERPYNHGNSQRRKGHSHFIMRMETAPQPIDLMTIPPTKGMQETEEEVFRLKGGGGRGGGLLESLA